MPLLKVRNKNQTDDLEDEMSNYSMKQIVESFEQKKAWEKQFPINYFLVRPLSFLITYPVLRIIHSPSKVAWTGFVIGVVACFAFLGLSLWTIWPGIIFISIFSILDAVDGNIARTTKNVTYYGKFLDSLIGEVIEGSYCFCIGVGVILEGLSSSDPVVKNGGVFIYNIMPLLAAAIIIAGRLYSSFIDLKYQTLFFEKKVDENTIEGRSIYDPIGTSVFKDQWIYKVFVNFNLLNNQIIFLIIVSLFWRPDFFLYFLAIYYFTRGMIYFIFFMRRAEKRLH